MGTSTTEIGGEPATGLFGRFAVTGATAGLPGPVLSSAEDVYFPAPGLTLDFNRVSLQPINGRYRLGRPGRGGC